METVFLSLSKNDFQDIIAETVNACLRYNLPTTTTTPEPLDRWYDLDGLRQYLPDKPARQTVYALVSKNLIPNHKSGKKLRFLKSEIDIWLKQGRRKTVAEIEANTDAFLGKRKQSSKN